MIEKEWEVDIENSLKEMIADDSAAIISVDFAKAVLKQVREYEGQLNTAENELIELRAKLAELESQKPVAWGAFYFGGKYRGQLYSHTPSEEQIEDYIAYVHRSDDSITLRKGPLYAKPVPSDLEIVQKALSLEDVELTLNGGGSSTFVTNDYKESVRYFANNAELLTWAKQTIGGDS